MVGRELNRRSVGLATPRLCERGDGQCRETSGERCSRSTQRNSNSFVNSACFWIQFPADTPQCRSQELGDIGTSSRTPRHCARSLHPLRFFFVFLLFVVRTEYLLVYFFLRCLSTPCSRVDRVAFWTVDGKWCVSLNSSPSFGVHLGFSPLRIVIVFCTVVLRPYGARYRTRVAPSEVG